MNLLLGHAPDADLAWLYVGAGSLRRDSFAWRTLECYRELAASGV